MKKFKFDRNGNPSHEADEYFDKLKQSEDTFVIKESNKFEMSGPGGCLMSAIASKQARLIQDGAFERAAQWIEEMDPDELYCAIHYGRGFLEYIAYRIRSFKSQSLQ